MTVVRYPQTMEQALLDTLDSIADADIQVVFTKEVMVEMLQLLLKLKHS